MNTEKIELNAVVELFGHQRIAGKVTEQAFGSFTFIRIDVPETPLQPSFTRLVNPTAIYAINPVTEEVWLNVTATDDETDPPFFGTKKQAKKFAKKVECKIKKAIDTDIQNFERLNNFIP